MEDTKVFETRMDFWRKAVKYLYKDLQEFHKWSDNKVWLEVKNEMIKNSEGNIGSNDLDWIQGILSLKKDINLYEAKRMY